MRLAFAFLLILSNDAFAQIPAAADSGHVEPAASDTKSNATGGCMPIGLTASGVLVFPIECKTLIESIRGPTSENTETTGAIGPVHRPADDKPSVTGDKAVVKPVQMVDQKPVRQGYHRRAAHAHSCVSYQTFNAATQTYRDFKGRKRSCRSKAGRGPGNSDGTTD
jgi:hypothetical protein